MTTDILAAKADHLRELYTHLHENPELSFEEKESSERMAAELRLAGYEVHTEFGGYGVVGILQNGEGPCILIRTDMDALPVYEKTGLNYASTRKVVDHEGNEVAVMHACGHDMHMTVWTGTAYALAQMQEKWNGTLIMIAQPAEERVAGALAMLEKGLYTKFPKPDYALALHVSPTLQAGTVGICPGYAMANVEELDITIHGVGGHGAYPHECIDPIVLASKIVMDLQTIVSRRISPLDSAVVTVASIKGGTKHNIIPDQVELKLTLRSYTDEVRTYIRQTIKQITAAAAMSVGLPPEKYPEVKLLNESVPALYNHPALAARLKTIFTEEFGEEKVIDEKPVMAGEDFSQYGRTEEKVPVCLFWLGAVSEQKMNAHREYGEVLPPLHSPFFAPDPLPTIQTGVRAMSAAAIDLFRNK